jgi:NAD(P)-dependent dehydrogenase (short-subunit alcohol dehydrogenase family)
VGNRDRLTDTIVVVTGAGCGIGRAIATACAAEGASVVVAEIDDRAGEVAAAELKDAGGDARFVPTDVSDATSVASLVDDTLVEYGRIDVLVNNAGLLSGRTSLLEATAAEVRRFFDVNALGALAGHVP